MQKPKYASWFMTSIAKTSTKGGIEISGLKVLLSGYFLTYGAFGYGSSLDSTRVVTLLPLITGIGFCLAMLWWIRTGGRDWTYTLRFNLATVGVFSSTLASLILMNWRRLGDELISDELSYAQLSHAHALEALRFAPQLVEPFTGATVLRLASVAVIIALVASMWLLIWRQSPKVATLLTLFGTLALQLAFSLQGGWGWGYTKVAWFPYLVGTTVFGISPEGFRLTSLTLVAAGLSLVFHLLRSINLSVYASASVIAALASIPSASAFFASVDHVHFFVVLALPFVLFLIFPANRSWRMWIPTLLAIGVSFRITTAFIMMALLVGLGLAGRESWTKESIGYFGLPFLYLLPYLVGVLTNAPLGDRVASQPNGLTDETSAVLLALDSQIGLIVLSLLILGLGLAALLRQALVSTVVYLLLVTYFYFFFLRSAGLVGEYKYTVEWALSLTLIALLLTLRAVGAAKSVLSVLIPASIILSNIAVPPISEAARAKLSDAVEGQSPLGYRIVLARLQNEPCQPVGVVYGAGSEITLGKTWEMVSRVRENHAKLQEAIADEGMDWRFAYPELSDDLALRCLYGTIDSFPGLGEGEWRNWNVAMLSGLPSDSSSVVVLKQKGAAQSD